MNEENKFIRFDWAAKRMLRDKANFAVLEGLIGDDTCTPGLKEARERLRLLSMSAAERQNYDRHMEEQMIENDELNTAKLEGWEKGIEQGREQGREQGEREAKRQIALAMMQQGLPAEQICRLTGLTADELVAMQQG